MSAKPVPAKPKHWSDAVLKPGNYLVAGGMTALGGVVWAAEAVNVGDVGGAIALAVIGSGLLSGAATLRRSA